MEYSFSQLFRQLGNYKNARKGDITVLLIQVEKVNTQ